MRKWTIESAIKESKKYSSKMVFIKECVGCYNYCRRVGILDEACSHMKQSNKITYTFAKSVVQKYSIMKNFRTENESLYTSIKSKGWSSLLYNQFPLNFPKENYDYNYCLSVALKHSTKKEFRCYDRFFYDFSYREGWLYDICNDANLKDTGGGFRNDLPGLFYIVKINGLFKYGITNNSVKDRYPKKEFKKMKILYEEKFDIGKDASSMEGNVREVYKNFHYVGEPFLKSGNSELLTVCPDINSL